MESVTEKRTLIDQLLEVAFAAKGVGHYDVANAAFAMLLDVVLGESFEVKRLTLEWETQDWEGRLIGEVYYDLLIIVDSATNCRLSIPVPLLNKFAAVSALKASTVVERDSHCTNARQGDLTAVLWERLKEAEVSCGCEIKSCVLQYLDPEGCEELFRTLGLIEEDEEVRTS